MSLLLSTINPSSPRSQLPLPTPSSSPTNYPTPFFPASIHTPSLSNVSIRTVEHPRHRRTEKREEKEKYVGRASNNAISIPEISGVLPSGTWSVGHGPVRWHPPGHEWGEGARGPIIAESGGCPWLRPGSRGRDAPRLEDSRLVAECLLFSSGAKKDSRPLRFVSKGVGPLRAFVSRARGPSARWEYRANRATIGDRVEAASDAQAAVRRVVHARVHKMCMCTRDAEQGCELRNRPFFFCKSAWPSLLADCYSVYVVNFVRIVTLCLDVRYCRGMNVCMMIVTWTLVRYF